MAKSNLIKDKDASKKLSDGATRKPGASSPPPGAEQPPLRTLQGAQGKTPAAIQRQDRETTQTAAPAAAGSASASSAAAPAAASSGAAASSVRSPASVGSVLSDEVEEARLRYEDALASFEALRGATPNYTSRYDEQIRDLYEQITGRGSFRYDSATDPLYQQYRQDYIMQGRMAMRDTMGQAAALSGGYGSSWAQSVGQQQYDAYLRRLADVLPETYAMAFDAWQAEGDALRGKYETTASLEKSDYDRYLDRLGQYNRDLSLARDEAQSAYEHMIYSDETAYDRQQDAYSRLLTLLAAGYVPTVEEYAAAGLTRAQGEALRARLAPSSSSGSSGGGRRRRKKDDDDADFSKSSGTTKGSGDFSKSLK